MTQQFKLPDLGEGVHEGQVIRIHVREGDSVREDQPLMEVETDKAAVEIPCPNTGVVQKVHVTEGQLVHVGDIMITFGEGVAAFPANQTADLKADAKRAVSSPPLARGPRSEGQGVSAEPARSPGAPNGKTDSTTSTITAPRHRTPASPAVRKHARTLGIDINTVRGFGPAGRVSRADLEAHAAGGASTDPSPQSRGASSTSTASLHQTIAAVPRITIADLPAGADDSDAHGQLRRVPISMARRTIAQIMAEAWRTIPHVTDSDEADVTDLEAIRKRNNQSLREGEAKLSLLPFMIRAVASALQRHPIFNASFDSERGEIIYKRYINISLGVQTERGLVAPVIRSADQRSVMQLNERINELTQRVRSGSFAVEELRGGTFTISNAGAMGGSRFSTPIVTPPQVAVLALGRTRWRPWVVGGESDRRIEPRFILPLSLSFDHRIIDGAEEIAFQQDIIASLENPVRMM